MSINHYALVSVTSDQCPVPGTWTLDTCPQCGASVVSRDHGAISPVTRATGGVTLFYRTVAGYY